MFIYLFFLYLFVSLKLLMSRPNVLFFFLWSFFNISAFLLQLPFRYPFEASSLLSESPNYSLLSESPNSSLLSDTPLRPPASFPNPRTTASFLNPRTTASFPIPLWGLQPPFRIPELQPPFRIPELQPPFQKPFFINCRLMRVTTFPVFLYHLHLSYENSFINIIFIIYNSLSTSAFL